MDFFAGQGFLRVLDALFNWDQLENARTPASEIAAAQNGGQSEYQRLDVLRLTPEYRQKPIIRSPSLWRSTALVLVLVCAVLVILLSQVKLSTELEIQRAYDQLGTTATRLASSIAESGFSSATQQAIVQATQAGNASLNMELMETLQAQEVALTADAVQIQSLLLSEDALNYSS